MRKEKIAVGEYYHVFGRGVNKQQIFFNERDYVRFLFYILFFQAPIPVLNIGRRVTDFLKTGDFGIPPEAIEEIIKKQAVEIVNFVFMPNHVHFILGEIGEGGISKMMQRTFDGFSRYTHVKYGKSGHIFEGPFRAVHIKDDTQLLYLSTYIHKNPKELKEWQNNWEYYPWSSYQDFVGENRWGDLLSREIILGQFNNPKEYARFTSESTAKDLRNVLDDELLLDL